MTRDKPSSPQWLTSTAKAVFVIWLIYMFLVAIGLLSGTLKALGREQAEAMITSVTNPFAALSVGILATVLVQSSSVTTATIVATMASFAVGRDLDDPDQLLEVIRPFVPMIMGANIGTTITNTLASLGSVTRPAEFERAFAGATIHDFFNVICVLVFLPLEVATGFLSRSAVWGVSVLNLGEAVQVNSPVKQAVKATTNLIQGFVENVLGLEKASGPWTVILLVIGLMMIFICLIYITKTMKGLLATRLESSINRVLERSAFIGIITGMLVTVAVQSSSITTSILVPMFGAGLLSLRSGFPIMLGANVGTTVTALLAALAAERAGLAIAFAHLLFNVCGILLVYPFPPVRELPIRMARWLARKAVVQKLWVLGYVGVVFVLVPLLGILLFK